MIRSCCNQRSIWMIKCISTIGNMAKWVGWLGLLGMINMGVAREYPIGKPQEMNGMEVSAVYLQPIVMEPKGMMFPVQESDIHLEADIRALADNLNGFAEGDFIPYLNIRFELRKHVSEGKPYIQKGKLVPMVANDGPHYGLNVQLQGPGKYTVTYFISPPEPSKQYFGRHIDRETGVQKWFPPFSVENTFAYAGVGKKGGY